MHLNFGDWAVVGLYFLVALGIALWYKSRAEQGLAAFFVSGRSLPWWLAGTSMVATTFAADTPLAVTELTAKHGLAGNWVWWNLIFGSILTTFFFAKLWRRAEVMTDVEFSELRYSGKPAAFLRGFRAVYLALPINLIIMGWVNLAMAKILKVTLGWDEMTAVWTCLGLTVAYSATSGLWGVVVTDFFQFCLAMVGCVVLAFLAVARFDGLGNLLARAGEASPLGPEVLSLFPAGDSAWMPLSMFLAYLGVTWWASWYPGAEPGGGGYVAQRLFAAKNEKHAMGASLWFSIAMFALRPWPWILVALASVALYPGLADPAEGFPKIMLEVLPSPLKGMLLASFLAAYMSTLSTHLNWGASYLVGDVYKRFLRRDRSDAHYVMASRVASVLLGVLSVEVTRRMDSISGAWMFLVSIGAGCGAVYILRWYWWRINAWSEIAAMAGAAAISLTLQFRFGWSASDPAQFGPLLLITTAGTSATWLAATFLTAPEPEPVLRAFYKKVAPSPAGWGPVAAAAGKPDHEPIPLGRSALGWVLGCACVYAALFFTGEVLLGRWLNAAGLLLVAGASGAAMFKTQS